ncbi:sensor histidine kinase [Flavobacterium frigidimaris]|uniref:sensor histidine kinase n=1 Tax=Flavobacterium frigidimaris TaxID=262320 RepID=UPI001A969523|nr:HAMP domain-containing sensor histidine kinase [Flavobacterium frigidimaris]
MRFFTSLRYCYLLLLLTTVKGVCQKNYIARWYTADNNELPQSSIKAIVQDKYNFIWMTTENGLVRYDGQSFLVYNSATTNIQQGRFTEILGNIQKDSLYCYNDKKTELVLISGRKIKLVKKEAYPFYKIIRNEKRYYSHDGIPSNNTINPHDPYYIKLSNGNLFFIDSKQVELCDSKMKTIYKIAYKSENVFNFFTINNVLFYLNSDGTYDCFTNDGKSVNKLNSALFKTKYKLYWNITSKQVFLYSQNKIYLLTADKNQLAIQPIVEFKNFEKSNIISLFYDLKNQKLYLGSYTNGLCVISFPDFKTVKKDPLKAAEVYYAGLPLSDSTIVTAEGYIVNNKRVIDSLPFVKTVYLNDHLSIEKDDYKNLWIISLLSVQCYLKESGYKKYINYNFEQAPKTLFKDKSNTIWVSMESNEFHKAKLYYIKNGVVTLVSILKENINYISQFDYNTLLLGTDKGLFTYKIDSKKFFFIKNSEKLNIRSIFIDSERKVWLTTYEKGFFLFANNTLHAFPKDEENYLNSSHCIVEDKKGFFWIPTNKGLFQVSRKALLKYNKNKTGAIYYHQYNKKDGFLTNEFNGGCQPNSNYLKNNEVVFPSMNGFVFFNPDKITPLLPGKDFFIDKVIVDQTVISPKDTIVLKNNFQRVKFLIDYPYYGTAENINIEAKLDIASDTRWEKIRGEKSISFTTLPPGKYVLILRSLSGFDGNYAYKKFTIIVPAQFHQTFWFTILCYLLAMLFLLFIWYLRLYYIKLKNVRLKEVIDKKTKKLAKTVNKLKTTEKNLKQEIKQQETLVKSISHDIKSPLKFLTASLSYLSDNANIQQDEKLKRQIETIQLSSDQLYEYVENLIKYSTIFLEGKKLEDKSYSLYDLIEEKILIFEKIAKSENTIIINKVPKDFLIKTNNKALSIIIHNLLDNAIKNTTNGQIELQCATKDNKLSLTVMDDGKGMSRELIDYYLDFYKNPIVKNYHLGLHMIIELLLIIKGKINISSSLNEGTIIEIIVDFA